MGVTAAMYAWGMEYEDPNNPYHMDGYFNSAAAAEAVEFYKKLYEDCAPPGHSDAYMVANLDAYKSGQVAFQMNWYAFWPGVSKEDSDGRETGFFANPCPEASDRRDIKGGCKTSRKRTDWFYEEIDRWFDHGT
jgi:multiple sugar transport system substrate-binding protein